VNISAEKTAPGASGFCTRDRVDAWETFLGFYDAEAGSVLSHPYIELVSGARFLTFVNQQAQEPKRGYE
jgi:hypothetical protein